MLRGLAKHHTSSETDMVFRLKRKERAALEKYLEKNPNAGKTRFDEEETKFLWKVFGQAVPAVFESDFDGLGRDNINQISPFLSKVVTQANEALVHQLFRVMDRSKDGLIDFEEWITTVSICTRGNLDEQLELTFLLFDSDENGTVSREEVRYLVTETGRFLEFVAKGMLSKTELLEQKEQMAQDIFMGAENLPLEVFKQRAMNNNVILNCFGLMEYLFYPVVQEMELELGRQNKVFKVSLQHLLTTHNKVPPLLIKAAKYIRETNAINTEGLFRLSGNINELLALKQEIDHGKDIDTITWKPLLAADLIKALLRELPEPLLTYAFYEPFILLASQKDVETRLVKARALISSLPDGTIKLVEFLCELFHDVSQHPDNKMTVKNLAVVFAPIFLQRKDGDLDKGVKETTPAIAVVSFLIENHVSLFKDIGVKQSEQSVQSDDLDATIEADEAAVKQSYKTLATVIESLEARLKSKNETIRQLRQQNLLLKEKLAESSRKSLTISTSLSASQTLTSPREQKNEKSPREKKDEKKTLSASTAPAKKDKESKEDKPKKEKKEKKDKKDKESKEDKPKKEKKEDS